MAKASVLSIALVDALNALKGNVEYARQGTNGDNPWGHVYNYHVMPGGKYDRIVVQSVCINTETDSGPYTFDGAQRMVHCFVDRISGDVLAPAGWASPAKWKGGPATEWNLRTRDEFDLFLAFQNDTRHGGFYKGSRKAWEDKRAEALV